MRVFVSYRRADTADFCGRLVDRLRLEPGITGVFLDVEGIAPGLDYRRKLEGALASADVVLVIVGPAWEGAREGAPARIHDDDDPVRLEVRWALEAKVRTVPILANRERLPGADALPAELAPLSFLNAVSVRHSDFARDVAHLAQSLGASSPAAPAARRSYLTRAVLGLLAGVVSLLVGAVVSFEVTGRSLNQWIGSGPVVVLGFAWVALWVALPVLHLARRG